ncbi:MAG: GNAT family N-acetyltransferase [Nannocystaceae bacterium]|nr:GNAT family N-acetyltransferase [Nannocystaceae bacterium]
MNAPVIADPIQEHGWLGLDDPDAWDAVVEAAGADVFHRAWFHRLARLRGEGEPQLFVWRTASVLVVVPLLFRDIPGGGGCDVSSVYGYVGPAVCGRPRPGDVAQFRRALQQALEARDVVSLFSRLHPLCDRRGWIEGLGQTVSSSLTLAVPLDGTDATGLSRYRGSHRREIARLQALGYWVQDEARSVDAFHELYASAMARLGAGSRYSFSQEHIRMLIDEGGMNLLVVRHGDDVAAAGLFTRGELGSHYFLSGTHPAHRKLAPSKLLVHAGCGWARERGAGWMHLGGGVGGSQDSLYRFKSGFGSRKYVFHTWRWVVDTDRYRWHCERVGAQDSGSFFPAYRCP